MESPFAPISEPLFQETVVCFTFDTDNCPDFAIDFVTDLLDSYNIPGTFFCDRPYKNILPPHERAIHPVLQSLRSIEEIIAPVREIRQRIPDAIGCRCHQLACNGNIYYTLPEMGIVYESSWPMALVSGIEPVVHPSGLLQLPIFFSEGLYFVYGIMPDLPGGLITRGLKIFCFHPVSLFHNLGPKTFRKLLATPPEKRYRREMISNEKDGALNLFKRLMEEVKVHSLACESLGQVAQGIIKRLSGRIRSTIGTK